MTRVVVCSVTSAGASLAAKLPWEHRSGRLVATVAELWEEVDALVLIAAAGVAVRAVAPHLVRKDIDPAVVSVDDAGRFAISLAGGHAGGANALAREVAALLGATAVITTATDGASLPGLDALPGFAAEGDIAGVTRAWLDGRPPAAGWDDTVAGWPLPAGLDRLLTTGPGSSSSGDPGGDTGGRVTVTDSARSAGEGEVLLRPRSLVLGTGSIVGADPEALWELACSQLDAAGVSPASVAAVATLDRKRGEPAIVALAERLGVGLRCFDSATLDSVEVPAPSATVREAVGTASVSEAAALLGAGRGSKLIAGKKVSVRADSTLAIARRAAPEGSLAVVGLGPGDPARRTPEAAAAVRGAGVVIGYAPYVDLAGDLLGAHQDVVRSPIGSETERCREALSRAAAGATVALVCSGDPGVYAMASLVCELSGGYGDPPVTVVPGVTAALSGAALLGAPLGHDHCAISLSDLLTPWEVIARRLEAAAAGDFVVSLYNPRSERRTTQLVDALAILGACRPASTPAAVLTDIGRPGQSVVRATLGDLDPSAVGMLSLVVVGSTSTRWIGDWMVTPRGYGGRA